jgi:Protein of unknown function (DUF4231)
MLFRKRKNHRTQELINCIQLLSLGDIEKEYLMSRWLQQLTGMDNAAIFHKTMHYVMRFVVVVGGVIIPILVGYNKSEYLALTFSISLIVAICGAINELFNYKEYWYHHRLNTELLRTEGWDFFLLDGPYQNFKTHQEAFETFNDKVKSILKLSLESFLANIIREKEKQGVSKNG